jgi:GTPase
MNELRTTDAPLEKGILVGAELRSAKPLLSVDESLDELELLASTAGIEVRGRVTQRLNRIDPATYIGSGKVQEVNELLMNSGANLVIFDDELAPNHQRELEKVFGEKVKVLDRSALILDIFAQHANSREGALQVELAQYEYRMPRLTRLWTHLARQAGGGAGRSGNGGVGLRGPGETQLEVDRRDIEARISKLRRDIEEVRAHRSRHRAQRIRQGVPVVAIVGYTNAGKSTLLNKLTGAKVYAADQLFATLDPTTRKLSLPSGKQIVVSDTVGFIQKLPPDLISAFRATLEEVVEADMILHVVDAAHPNASAQIETVEDTLAAIETPRIPRLLALNKQDLLDEAAISALADRHREGYAGVVGISARKGTGLDTLKEMIEATMREQMIPIKVKLPYKRGDLLSVLHEQGVVEEEAHDGEGVTVSAHIPPRIAFMFAELEA